MATSPTEHSYRWVIVALGALMTCVGHRRHVLAGDLPAADAAATGWSARRHLERHDAELPGHGRRRASAGGGQRPLSAPASSVLIGSVLLGLALVLASRATTLLAFQLIYGILVGLAAGAFFAPMIAAATGWFEPSRPRGLAGLGRHGRRADDGLALRRLAAHRP